MKGDVSERDSVVRERLRKARIFYETAKLVLGHKDYDSAMSRFYHSANQAIKAVLLNAGLRSAAQSTDHIRPIDEFVKLGKASSWAKMIAVPKRHRDLRSCLKWLYERRLDADYEPGNRIVRTDALEARTFVGNFIASVERIVK